MKSTVVDESLSSNESTVLFQRKSTSTTYILTLAVRDSDLRMEFRKLKDKDRTETRIHQDGTNWYMDNSTKDKYNATETVTKESIHAVGLHMKNNNSNKRDGKQNKNKFIKSCKYCGKGHNTGQCPARHAKCHKCSKVGHFATVCDLPIITQVKVSKC